MESVDRVKVVYSEKEIILIVDYSNLKEDKMIEVLLSTAKKIEELNKRIILISIYNEHCFVTPNFMRTAEKLTKELLPLIGKQAVIGLTPVKKLILKGYNFMFNMNIQNFETPEDAMKFLLDKTSN